MPVPVWDCTNMSLLEEPLDSVLSDDIWKKFDLDEPLMESQYIYGEYGLSGGEKSFPLGCGNYEENNVAGQAMALSELFYDKISCRESREIRHHDCMWAGLCISKEHNRTLPAKKDALPNSKKVPAGRSLLISSRSAQPVQKSSGAHQHQQKSLFGKQRRNRDGLESDGDSARPETPQSSESDTEDDDEDEEDDDDEYDEDRCQSRLGQDDRRTNERRSRPKFTEEPGGGPLIFKHDQISINDKLSECMADDINGFVRSAPVSEVTGQFVRKSTHYHPHHHHHLHHNGTGSANHQNSHRIKIEDEQSEHQTYTSHNSDNQQRFVKTEPDNWNTLNDHCYHQPSSKKLEHLGVQTPSDSEEEIDVVTFEKPCRPAVLPTYPSIADQQHFQMTVKSALKEKPVTAPRPRGRPPSSGTPRKRSAPSEHKGATTKRPRHRGNYQSRNTTKVTKSSGSLTPGSSPVKSSSAGSSPMPGQTTTNSRSSSSDDEPDTEKRSLHNNMERQRRIELRNAFEDLRLLVPEIEDKEKAPKVAILRQAAIYCDTLTEIDQATTARVIEMKKRQERLRARLSQLRRSLAMTR